MLFITLVHVTYGTDYSGGVLLPDCESNDESHFNPARMQYVNDAPTLMNTMVR